MSGEEPVRIGPVADLVRRGEIKSFDYFHTSAEADARAGVRVCDNCRCKVFTKVTSDDGYDLLRCASCGQLYRV